MEKVKLQAKKRTVLGKKVASLRREGLIPAVMYGKNKESVSLVLSKKEFDHIYREAGGNTIVSLEVEEVGKTNVLISEIAKDPVTSDVLHSDFYQVRMDEKITAGVPLHFVGDSKAVLELGGSLLTNKTEVEVECLPGGLPHAIEVDLAPLEDFESVIHIKDLVIPVGVEIQGEPDEAVAFVEAPRSEEELAELEEPVGEVEMPEAEKGAEEEPEATEEEQKPKE